MNKKLTKLLSVFIIAGAIGVGAAFTATGCKNNDGGQNQVQTPTVTGVTVTGSTTVANGGSVQLTATVNGDNSPSQEVTWKIKEGATATGATVSSTGLVSAGTVAGKVTVIATSVADATKSGEIEITVQAAAVAQPTVTSVTASADKTTGTVGDKITLTATVVGDNNPSQEVTWSITEGGDYATLSGNELTLTAAGTVKVQATSVADTTKKSDVLTITVQAASVAQPTVTGVTVTGSTTVANDGTVQLTATVNGENNPSQEVTWSIKDGATATGATVSATGLVSAGTVAGTVTVVATSVADTTKYGEIEITVQAASQPDDPVVEKYTVTWKNGDETIETDTEVEQDATPVYDGATPTKAADAQYTYTFSGWTDGTNEYAPDELPTVTGNVTYTATFDSAVNKYTYSFYGEDGTTVIKTLEVDYGTAIEAPAAPEKPATEQYTYTFDGWYTEKEGGEKVTSFGNVVGNVSYYARYTETAIDEFTVTFNVNGHGAEIANASTANKKVAAPTDPTAEGYTFGGWYATAECTGTAFDFDTELSDDTTLYAKWTAIEYTITYAGVDGLGNENPAKYTIETDTIELKAPTKDGYTFLGWYKDGEEITEIVKGSTGDVTLTAQWREITKFEILSAAENNRISEDFSSYEEGATLVQFTDWGNEGVYAKTGSEAEQVVVTGGQAKGVNSSKQNNISIMVDFGLVEGVVEGCFEFSFLDLPGSANGNSVNFYNGSSKVLTIMGHASGEVYTIENIPGVEVMPTTTVKCDKTSLIKVEYKFDLSNKTVTLKLNGETVCEELTCEITNVNGFEVVTSNGGLRGIIVDNIAVNGDDMSAETAKSIYSAYLTSKYNAMTKAATEETSGGTHLINAEGVTSAYQAGQSAINQATTVEEVVSAYASAVSAMDNYESDAVIEVAQTEATETINSYSADDYTITGLTGDNEKYNNKEAYDEAIEKATQAVSAAKSTAEIEEALSELKLSLEGSDTQAATIIMDASALAAKRQEAIAAVDDYKATEIAELTDETVKGQISAKKADGVTAINVIAISETVSAADAISAVDTKLAEIESDVDKLINSIGQTAADAKEQAKTDLNTYTQNLTDQLDAIADGDYITEINSVRDSGISAIEAIDDSAEASAVTEALNAAQLNVYKKYSQVLFAKYVAEVKAEIKDGSIELDATKEAAPEFAEATSTSDIDDALAAAKDEYKAYVDGVLDTVEYTVTFTCGEEEQTQTVKYGKAIDQSQITDPTAESQTEMLKGWKVDGADFDLKTAIYGDVTLTAVVVDAIYHEAVTESFNWKSITATTEGELADQKAPVLEGENAFITALAGLQYRTATDASLVTTGGIIQGVANNEAFSVTFTNSGTLTVSVRGGGNTTTTTFYLQDSAGNKIAATLNATPNSASSSFSEVDNVYTMYSKAYEVYTFTITEAGTYTFVVGEKTCRFGSIVQITDGYKTEKIAVESVTISGENTVEVGKDVQLSAVLTPDEASIKDVTWSVTDGDDGGSATISEDGLLTGVAAGTVTVTVTADGGKTATITVTVTKVNVTSVTISREDGEEIGEDGISISTGTIQLGATVLPEDASLPEVEWKSSNGEVVTVDGNGLVTYVGVGTATVTATADGVSGSVTITCTATPVTGVTISGESEVDAGDSIQLTAVIAPAEASDQTVTWSVADGEDGGSATISEDGVLTGVKVGTVTVTVTTNDGGHTATHTVTVNKVAVTAVTVSGKDVVEVGKTITLEATVTPNNATDKTVTWSSSDINLATVDENGVVTGVAVGSVTITATVDGVASEGFGVTINEAATLTTVGFSEATSEVVTAIQDSVTAGVYYDEYNILDFVYDSTSGISLETANGDTHVKYAGALKSAARYIKIDLSGYTGTATVSFTVYSGSAGRSMYLTTASGINSTTNANVLENSVATPEAKGTASITDYELECGNVYYICTDNTVSLSALTVTLDVSKKA